MLKLIPHKDAIETLRPVLTELGLTVRAANANAGTLQLDPRELSDVKLRDVSRVFLSKLGGRSHLEVYRGEAYVCYAFLTEDMDGEHQKFEAHAYCAGVGTMRFPVHAQGLDDAIVAARAYIETKDPTRPWVVVEVTEWR